jgi:hypothetical protein
MALTATAALTVNQFPLGLDKTQRRAVINGSCAITPSTPNSVTLVGATFAITSNAVTITVTHSFAANEYISISGITGTFSYLNGNYQITSVSTTVSFTFALTHANVSSTSLVNGTAAASALYLAGGVPVNWTAAVYNAATLTFSSLSAKYTATTNQVTIYATNALSLGQTILIAGASQNELNGVWSVTSASSTQFTFAWSGTAVTTKTSLTAGTATAYSVPALKDGNFNAAPFLFQVGKLQYTPLIAQFFSTGGGLTANPGYSYLYDNVNNTVRIFAGSIELANNAAINVDVIAFNAEFPANRY